MISDFEQRARRACSSTRLVQEAVDRFLEQHGGVEALIERGIAEFGEAGEEARLRRSGR